MPDGRLLFTSTASGLPQIWIADGDGSNERQLTTMVGPSSTPSVSPDGRWIYFSSIARDGVSLFRIAPDGSGLMQLTRGVDAQTPIVSLDGNTVYFNSTMTGQPRLMKVPSGGGDTQPVSQKYFRVQDLSKDGTELVGATWDAKERRTVLATYSLKDDSLSASTLPPGGLFLPDGQLLTLDRGTGKAVLVSRAPSGGPSRAMSPPLDESVFNAAVSKDGRIVIAAGRSTNDVVLIRAK
jgi:dipeptidyl aminopeptidase/acylaminoacyl peptidase